MRALVNLQRDPLFMTEDEKVALVAFAIIDRRDGELRRVCVDWGIALPPRPVS